MFFFQTVYDDPTLSHGTNWIRQCSSSHGHIWMTVLYVYKALLLLYAAHTAWTIRTITLPSMNDSTYVFLNKIIIK